MVDNAVGKGEIARYEHFLLFFHIVFKRLALHKRKLKDLFGKRIKSYLHQIETILDFVTLNLASDIEHRSKIKLQSNLDLLSS